jgi:hypothetical protein
MAGEFGEMPITMLPQLTYQMSFGNMPHGTVYLDRLSGFFDQAKSIDRREDIKQEIKALTTSSNLFATGTNYTSTSGSIPVLVPTVVDSNLYDVTFRKTPLASGLLPRVTNNGLFADYVARTALSTAKWRAESGALPSAESTYTRYAKAMSFCYAVAELSGPLMVASQVWQNALKNETEGQYRSLKELEENTIINGNPTSADVSGGVTDAKAFKGLINSITTNYTNGATTAKVTLASLRDAIRTIREAKGDPDLIVTDYKTLDDIKGDIQDLLRYPAPTGNINFGIESIVFEGVPIIPDLFMPTTATARELLVLTVKLQGNIQLRVLQEATFEELAKTADTYKFMIKEYLTLIIVNEAWCYRFYALA